MGFCTDRKPIIEEDKHSTSNSCLDNNTKTPVSSNPPSCPYYIRPADHKNRYKRAICDPKNRSGKVLTGNIAGHFKCMVVLVELIIAIRSQ